MIYSYNFQLIESQDLRIGPENRLFQYGDGLFETIILRNGTISNLDEHYKRLIHGAEIMKISCDNHFFDRLDENLRKIVASFNKPNGKIKIHLWRTEGGLFEPMSNEPSILISICDFQQKEIHTLKSYSFYRAEGLVQSRTSSFKSSSASEYVLAGLEKKLLKCDELIILNRDSHLTECLYSNLYWVKGQELFTPSLESGCISGISRKFTLDYFASKNIRIQEGLFVNDDIENADMIFNTNVANIQILKPSSTNSIIQSHLEEIHRIFYS